jgi:hypothetical protein
MNNEQIDQWIYFPSAVYSVNKSEYLKEVSKVSDEYLNEARKTQKLNPIYPMIQSGAYLHDERLKDFFMYILNTGWQILSDQGYNMQNMSTFFLELWTQEHHKTSQMEQHVHMFGAQLVGFYFLECPEGGCKIVVHDPRPGKVQINLPETNAANATMGSNMINFDPKPGQLYFTNAWLPHSFTRNTNKKPTKFIHFNIGVQFNPNAACPTPTPAPAAEIV